MTFDQWWESNYTPSEIYSVEKRIRKIAEEVWMAAVEDTLEGEGYMSPDAAEHWRASQKCYGI